MDGGPVQGGYQAPTLPNYTGNSGAGQFLRNLQMTPATFQPRTYQPPSLPPSGLLGMPQRQQIAPVEQYGLLSAGGGEAGMGGPPGVGGNGGDGFGGPAQGGISGGPGEGDGTSGSDGGGGGGGGK